MTPNGIQPQKTAPKNGINPKKDPKMESPTQTPNGIPHPKKNSQNGNLPKGTPPKRPQKWDLPPPTKIPHRLHYGTPPKNRTQPGPGNDPKLG